MNTPDACEIARLADRITAGEAIDLATLPPGLADDPRAQALLRFAGVAGALSANATRGPEASAPAAPTAARIAP